MVAKNNGYTPQCHMSPRSPLNKGGRGDFENISLSSLEVEILKGLGSGEATPMTAQDWQDIRANIRNQ